MRKDENTILLASGAALGLFFGARFLLLNTLKDKSLKPYLKSDPVDNLSSARTMYKFMRKVGIPRNSAIGMLNNAYHESRFRPDAYHIDSNNKPSGGLFQWNGNRFFAMQNFVPDWRTNWKGQILYALKEYGKEYLSKHFTHPADASYWFTVHFERPANTEQSARNRLRTINTIKRIG